jgi:hypothetical protein
MKLKDTIKYLKSGVVQSDVPNDSVDNPEAPMTGCKKLKGTKAAPYKLLIPTVKLGERATYHPWEHISYPVIAVRMEDMLLEDGRSFNDIVDDIQNAGGIRQYLDCPGSVILSTVMRDKLIAGSTVDTYIDAIRTLKPGFCTTPDGQTYEHETSRASREIDRMMDLTLEIMDKFPDTSMLGLVKGSNVNQIREHVNRLACEGVQDMVLHTGDFLHRGTRAEAHRAQLYAHEIKANNYDLYVYGIGPGRHMRNFFFADGFITQSHYIGAYKRQLFHNNKWQRIAQKGDKDTILRNLDGANAFIRRLENESFRWWN